MRLELFGTALGMDVAAGEKVGEQHAYLFRTVGRNAEGKISGGSADLFTDFDSQGVAAGGDGGDVHEERMTKLKDEIVSEAKRELSAMLRPPEYREAPERRPVTGSHVQTASTWLGATAAPPTPPRVPTIGRNLHKGSRVATTPAVYATPPRIAPASLAGEDAPHPDESPGAARKVDGVVANGSLPDS